MEKQYTVTLSFEDLKIVSAALHEMPYRLVKDLLTRMQAEVSAQDVVPPPAPKTEPPAAAEDVSQ